LNTTTRRGKLSRNGAIITEGKVRLIEQEGKSLLRRHGIPVPRGVLLRPGEPVPEGFPAEGALLKAQVAEGGRGKRGLVRRAAEPGAAEVIRAALGDPAAPLLLEEAVPIARELYLALRVDGTAQAIELLVSAEGGVEVESGAPPIRHHLDPEAPGAAAGVFAALRKNDAFAPEVATRLARLAVRLARVLVAEDLELLEINPLAQLADGRLVACDAKLVRDDAAASRHAPATEETPLSAALAAAALTPLERRAREQGFHLVELPGGAVAMVTAGAGLGMLMLDLLGDHGLPAACFMDNAQGGPDETMPERLAIAFEIARRPEVKAVLFYTTIASRPLKGRVEALAKALRESPPPKPLFVGFAAAHASLAGYSLEQARAALRAAGVAALHDDPLELVQALKAAVG
jgi:succinyl-CoA synthetase beta subunit